MTARIYSWPRHLRYRCPPGLDRCVEGRCAICAGGLFACVTCGGAEGDLPSDCPGHQMPESARRAIMADVLDYNIRRGGWIRLAPGGDWRAVPQPEGD